MAMGLLENICGVLIGFLMAAGAIVSGLFDTFGAPSAMLDAVFMPFSHKSASRHNQYKIDQFYKRLTRRESRLSLRLVKENIEHLLNTLVVMCRVAAVAVEVRSTARRASIHCGTPSSL